MRATAKELREKWIMYDKSASYLFQKEQELAVLQRRSDADKGAPRKYIAPLAEARAKMKQAKERKDKLYRIYEKARGRK